MKMTAMTAIAASLAFVMPALAEEAHHPETAQEAKAAPVKPAPKAARPGGEGCPMMKDGMMGGKGGGMGMMGGGSQDGMMERMHQMEKRMDMMQMMMERMMRGQEGMPPPAPMK